MNFEYITPEKAGISSEKILRFIKTLEEYNFCTHSMIMSRGNKIFTELYYAPFSDKFLHRMYSVSKSFISVALGMAMEDGLLSLDDKMVDYFTEYDGWQNDEKYKEATIRDLLTMESAVMDGTFWFTTGTKDRNEVYFRKPSEKIPGTLFYYDSPGSYMLGVIVEKVTGKPFLEYLKEKALTELGFSNDSYCIKAPGGYSFGDSGVMCTAKDLLIFARFVMNKGICNGKSYMKSDYLTEAVKKQVCNDNNSMWGYNTFGYGYQIWKTPRDGFAFIGMGDQFAICDPKTDFIFIINSDNQGNTASRPVLYHTLYKEIVEILGEPLEENPKAYEELCEHIKNARLHSLPQSEDEGLISEINNKKYILEKNPMGIEYIKFSFEGKKGLLQYKNAQGEKELMFGIGYNEFGKFPETGYSDMVTGEVAPGHMYDCACSAVFAESKKLRIKVQIIDKYFGNASFVFSFKDNRVGISMMKTAETFLEEYNGTAIGKIEGGN